MATRSYIARKTLFGYVGVYCHWDGYPTYNGKILLKHYQATKAVKKLLSHGDISSLGTQIGDKHDFDSHTEGQTTFYHRDREEGWKQVKPRWHRKLASLNQRAEQSGCEYVYLWQSGAWYYAERGMQFFGLSDGSKLSAFKLLTKDVTESNDEH